MTLRERALALGAAGIALTSLLGLPGPPTAESAASYYLPYPKDQTYAVTQAGGTGSHTGMQQFAVDFAMPAGSVIAAARAGTVKFVRQDSNRCGCSPAFGNDGNYVVVDHGDGTQALYLHVSYNSAEVKVGEKAGQGQPLARSGMTGWSCGSGPGGCGPHLHFQIERSGIWFTSSVFVAFADILTNNGVAQAWQSYRSGNERR